MTIRQLKSVEIEKTLELSWDGFSDTETEYSQRKVSDHSTRAFMAGIFLIHWTYRGPS